MITEFFEPFILIAGFLAITAFLIAVAVLSITWFFYRVEEFRFNKRFLKDVWRRAIELEAIEKNKQDEAAP